MHMMSVSGAASTSCEAILLRHYQLVIVKDDFLECQSFFGSDKLLHKI